MKRFVSLQVVLVVVAAFVAAIVFAASEVVAQEAVGVDVAASGNAPQGINTEAVVDASGNASPTSSVLNIITGAGTSTNARAPVGQFRYERTAWLITAAELASAGFPSGADVNLIGFNYSTGQKRCHNG